MEEKTTTPWLHARHPPKFFFVRLKQRKKKRSGGGGNFLTQCLLCFLSFWKLRDFSADRVGDSLHSLVFWRTCSPELYRPNKGLIREERVRERPDKFTKQTHTHSRGSAVCVPRSIRTAGGAPYWKKKKKKGGSLYTLQSRQGNQKSPSENDII